MNKEHIKAALMDIWPPPEVGETLSDNYWRPEALESYGFNVYNPDHVKMAEEVLNELICQGVLEVGIRKSDFLVLRRVR